MIRSSIDDSGGLDRIMARLDRYREIDLSPLADEIGRIVREDASAGIAAGTDTDGADFEPLAESTLKRRRGRDATPGGSLASSLVVNVQPTKDGIEVVVGWSGEAGRKAKFFTEGSAHQPARNIRGLRPESRDRIRTVMREFLARLSDTN